MIICPNPQNELIKYYMWSNRVQLLFSEMNFAAVFHIYTVKTALV